MLKYGLLSFICKESTQKNPRVWPGLGDEWLVAMAEEVGAAGKDCLWDWFFIY